MSNNIKEFNIKLKNNYTKEQADKIGKAAVVIANSMLSCGYNDPNMTADMMASSIAIASELYRKTTGADINKEYSKIVNGNLGETEILPMANVYSGIPKA